MGTTPNGGPYPTEGNNALCAGSDTGDPWVLRFVLTEPVNAVWFELTDAVERGDASIAITGLDNILVAAQGEGGAEPVVFGIVTEEPFSEFSLINTGLFDGWGVDEVMLGNVPSACATLSMQGNGSPVSILTLDLMTDGGAGSFAFLVVGTTEGSTSFHFGSLGTLDLGLSMPFIPVFMGFTDPSGDVSLSAVLPPNFDLSGLGLLAQGFTAKLALVLGFPPGLTFDFCTSAVVDFP